jgi:hypothetical protein
LLAREVLAEIPDQLLSYMKFKTPRDSSRPTKQLPPDSLTTLHKLLKQLSLDSWNCCEGGVGRDS